MKSKHTSLLDIPGPVMRSGIACALFAVYLSAPANAAPVDVDLTDGIWLISATDDGGLTWDKSTLTFENQIADGDDWLLEGYFYWIGSNGAFGRENFTGTLFFDRTLDLAGFQIVQPASGIVVGNYFAVLSTSGNEILNGSWDGNGIPSDDWSAVRDLPFVDLDDDGINDSADNCTEMANAEQQDTNGDGIGNACDSDLNDDCSVNFTDLALLKAVFFSTDPDADFNSSGTVSFDDLAFMKQFFFLPPGPSGLPNDCQP